MSQFRSIVGNFILATLLVASLFSFTIITQRENFAVDPITDNSIFNESFTGLISAIDSSTSDAQEKYSVFNQEEPKAGFGSIVLFGIVSVGKTFSGIVFGTFAAIIRLPLVILGIPESVYSLILTLLIISVIVAVWLLYKLGG